MNHANDNAPETSEPLRFLSVCSGIEAASVAWKPLGWKAVAFSEIEKFPSAVLAHHYPDVPNLGDFTKIDTSTLGRVDILCGGTPCQAFSVAGLRGGLNDARGNLTLAFVELAHELAAGNGLRNVVWENVVGVLSDKTNAFASFLAGLVGADSALRPPTRGKWGHAGLVSGPKGRAAWRVADAQYHGLAQRRRRVLVVADFGNGADPAQVLFELESVQRYSPPSREAGKDIAPTISARTKGGGGLGTDFDLDGGLIQTTHTISHPLLAKGNDSFDESMQSYVFAPEIARCVATREGSSQDYETTTMVAVGVTGDIAHTLKAEGADASEDGTGRGTPIVTAYRTAGDGAVYHEGDRTAPLTTATDPNANVICFSTKDYGADATIDLSPTLRAGGHSDSHANGGVMPAIAFAQNQLGGIRTSEVVGTLNTNANASGRSTQMTMVKSAVRRLTPVECERLQGFPDNYTDIPWRGKPNSPDGPRYKALGNSWAVPKFTWLGRRIAMHMPKRQEVKRAA